jgi:hypothetical protein
MYVRTCLLALVVGAVSLEMVAEAARPSYKQGDRPYGGGYDHELKRGARCTAARYRWLQCVRHNGERACRTLAEEYRDSCSR